jgi:hypothetical protein
MVYNGASFDPDSMDFFIRENITPDIENVLRNLKIEGNTVKITEQLDRKTYEGVNKVLERLGGKWNRSAKVHIFPSDPTERINAVLTTGKLVQKDLSVRVHSCPFCGLVLDRDHNAAINILNRSKNTVGTTEINACRGLLK